VAAVSRWLEFVSARERELRALARQIIEELGAEAGYQVGLFARLPKIAPDLRERLLAVADIIEREQGYGWYWGEEVTAR
jgi:hypothetical protein